jgi:hypothetical protein
MSDSDSPKIHCWNYLDIASAYNALNKAMEQKEGYGSSGNDDVLISVVITAFTISLLLVILAIYAIIQCGKIQSWSPYLQILLIILLFTPYVGGIVSIAVIVYWLVQCRSRTSVSYYY